MGKGTGRLTVTPRGGAAWLVSAAAGDPWKGALAGFLGGLAGAGAMSPVASALSKGLARAEDEAEEEAAPAPLEQNRPGWEELPSTEKVAAAVAERVLAASPDRRALQRGGQAVHYAFGGLNGALYGAAVEARRELCVGRGAGFGLALFLVADEVLVPALRLSGPPWREPPRAHAAGLGAHLVYGLVAEAVRRRVRAWL